MSLTTIWLIAMIAFAIIEALTVGIVSIWFALGALAAMILSYFVDSLILQIAVFLIVSGVVILVARPLLQNSIKAKFTPTNADRNVGRKCTVINKITADVPGRVRLDGVDWQAHSDKDIDEGTICVVKSVNSTVLYVDVD